MDISEVSDNVRIITDRIRNAEAVSGRDVGSVRLMAVTKTVDPSLINAAVRSGIDLLGENRVQEYLGKKDEYIKGTEVHFIGHLQSNKAKYIVGDVSLIHSVDSFGLAKEINRLASNKGIVQDILIEVNIGEEATKSGIDAKALSELAEQICGLENVRARGLMTIPPPSLSEVCFEKMQRLYNDMKCTYPDFDTLSMGMSADYELAVRYGSTIVRVGSALFGKRYYMT